MKAKYTVEGRIWVNTGNGPVLGWGRLRLLEEIQTSGSISKAAQAMKMSYKQAWQLIDSMNQSSPLPLVEKSKGGQGGGGAVVTETGLKAIAKFKKLETDFRAFLDKQTSLWEV